MLGLRAVLRLLLARFSEIEAECSGLSLPCLEQRRTLPWPLGLACAQRGEFHALGRTVTVCVSRLFDSLPAFGEGALDVAGDRLQAKACPEAFDSMALAFERVGEVLAVECAGFLLGLVEIAADETAPGSVPARGGVENERVRVQLGVKIAARVMMEAGDGQPGDRLADGTTLAAPGERVMVFEMGGRSVNGLAERGFDCLAIGWR